MLLLTDEGQTGVLQVAQQLDQRLAFDARVANELCLAPRPTL
jgi:hypothetical protein